MAVAHRHVGRSRGQQQRRSAGGEPLIRTKVGRAAGDARVAREIGFAGERHVGGADIDDRRTKLLREVARGRIDEERIDGTTAGREQRGVAEILDIRRADRRAEEIADLRVAR